MIKLNFSNNNGNELFSSDTIEDVKRILDFYGYNYKVVNFKSYGMMGWSEERFSDEIYYEVEAQDFDVKIFIKNPTDEDYAKLNFIFSGWSMMIICDGRYISDYEYDVENSDNIFPDYDRKNVVQWIKNECKRVNKDIDIDKKIKNNAELDYNVDEICSSATVGQLIENIRYIVSEF